MANCLYCEKPIAFLRKHHAACRRQHDAAAAKIPGFFVKCFESSLSGEKFHKLAVDVAKANYIGDKELRQLAIKGLSALMDSLANRVLTETENDRIAKIRNSFGIGHGDLGEAAPKLTKVDITDSQEGRLSNRVGPKDVLPVNLQLLPINLKKIAISLSEAPNGGRGLIIIPATFIFATFFALIAGGYIAFGLISTPHHANENSETGSLSTNKDELPTAITEENLRTAITRNYSCVRVHEFRQAGLDKTGSVYIVDCGNAIYQVLVDRKGMMTAGLACGDGWQCGITTRY